MAILLAFSRALIGVTFALSAASKLRGIASLREFARSITDLRIVGSKRTAATLAIGVATAEALVCVLMVPLPEAALAIAGYVLASVLLVAFIFVIVLTLRRGVPATCRCFGGAAAVPFGRRHVVRNALLLVIAAAGASTSAAGVVVPGPAWAIGAAFGVVCAVVVSRFDDVVGLFSPASGTTVSG